MKSPAVAPMTSLDRAKWFLIGSVAVSLILPHLPFGRTIGFPLMLLSTVAHEMGHALTAKLLGGTVESVDVFMNGSGLAHPTGAYGRLAYGLVAAGGLVGPACAAALCFLFARSARLSRVALVVLGGLVALSVVFWIRNAFGLVYMPLVAATLVASGWKAKPHVAQLVLVFLAVQLALSVYTRVDYLFTDKVFVGGEERLSDVSIMAKELYLPYWFWGFVCASFSGVVLAGGMWLFWRDGARAQPAKATLAKATPAKPARA